MVDDARIRRVEAILAEVRKRVETHSGPCSACKWSRAGLDRTCRHPFIVAQKMTLDDSYDRERAGRCTEQRGTRALFIRPLCGPEGAFFEPGFWRSLRDWLAGDNDLRARPRRR